MTRRRRVFALLFALVTMTSLAAGFYPASAAPLFTHYVALGDSYASGPFILNQRTDPIGCFRSDHNYASDLARALGIADFTDVSCGGATTVNMMQPQSVLFGTNPPQLNAVTADADLVTITISGNDIGFSSILETCVTKSLTDPFGNPCQQHYTAGGVDQLATSIANAAPKVAAVLSAIRQRAPHAHVVVVGYLRILPPSGGCWPVVPIAAGDVPYLDSVEHELNSMLGLQASAAGDTFVNPGLTTGHDVCQLPGVKWVEGIVPTSPAFPVHPNAAGMSHVARLILSTLS